MKTINITSFLVDKEVWLQTLLWTLFFTSITVSWTDTWIAKSFLPESVAPHIALSIPIIFLLNVYWLIPKYLNKKKWPRYVWLSLSMLIAFEVIRGFVFTIVLQGSDTFLNVFKDELFGENSLIFGLLNVMIITIVFYSFVYRFTRDWILNQSIIEKLKSEKQLLLMNSQQMVGDSNGVSSSFSQTNYVVPKSSDVEIKSIKKTLSVKKRDGIALIKIEDVLYFQAQGDFVFAFDKENNKHIINESLKTIRETVCVTSFFQINRGEMINFNYIAKYKSYLKNRLEISLLNTTSTLFTSNSRTPEFRLWIEQH